MEPAGRKIVAAGRAAILTGAFFLWFFIFNRYHLWNLEQNQLFRYNADYLSEFLNRPGGIAVLTGAFFTQFFYFQWLGAFIVTICGLLVFLTGYNISIQYGKREHAYLISLIPAILYAAALSVHNFTFSLAVAWFFILSGFRLYIKIERVSYRYMIGLGLFMILYLAAGSFAFIFVVSAGIHELLFKKQKQRYTYVTVLLAAALCIPLILQQFVFLITPAGSWILPLNTVYLPSFKLQVLFLSLSLPFLIIVSINPFHLTDPANRITEFTTLAGVIMLMLYSYERKNELFLKIDHQFNKGKWNEVLSLSEKYPGNNRLVMYYTNLALAKKGQLSDKMFNYKQSGPQGLWLDWSRNETAPLYGGEFYFTTGYLNEAFRWTFEAMEINSPSPRVLKRLVHICQLNDEPELASKYSGILRETLFYRKWTDVVKANKSSLHCSHDFISTGNHQQELINLLENNPQNRTAFEYLMAFYLLNGNPGMIARNLNRLSILGYEKIPVHLEEALILYEGMTGRSFTPPGYLISETTRNRFHEYAGLFAANRFSIENASRLLQKKFGNTFWYYMQFSKPENAQK